MNNELVRDLFIENPMLDEATRMRRKFSRGGRGRGRVLYYGVGALIVFVFMWSIGVQVIFDQDSSPIIQFGELLLITLIIPASVFGAIAGERERATWEAIVLTRLTPSQIIVGKMAWRILIIVAILFFLSLSLGISQDASRHTDRASLGAVISGQAMIFCWGLFLAAFGLWVSSINRKAITAAGILFSVLFATVALFPILLATMNVDMSYPGSRAHDLPPFAPAVNLARLCVQWNPFYTLSWLLTPQPVSMPAQSDWWSVPRIGWSLAALYSIACGGFLNATACVLKKLEEPKRRSE